MANERPYAMVTGASSGIGLELAKQLADKDYNLILSARSVENLERIAKEIKGGKPSLTVHVVPADLAKPEGASELFSKVKALNLDIEVLINNAGFGMTGKFDELSLPRQLEMIQLNVSSFTEILHLFLPALKARGKGYILNTASAAGLIPAGPGMAVYCATKSYVASLSLATNQELKGTGVSVTALCPGATQTGFFSSEVSNNLAKIAQGNSPTKVASVGLRALFGQKDLVIPGLINQIQIIGGKFMPRRLMVRMIAGMLK